MRHRVSLPAAIASVVVAVIAPCAAQSRPTGERGTTPPAPIDTVLATAAGRNDIPGVVAIAADRRGIIYRGAFGVAEKAARRPMTEDRIFRIASMTKAVTSVALMQLVEQKRIAIEDPAEKYLPELGGLSVITSFDERTGGYTVQKAAKPLTVRHLLTHTSGLGYPFTSAILRDFKARDGERYTVGPLLFEPGERWHYGTSTDWVGRLVEAVSGQNLDSYFTEHILRPLGMSDTFFNVPEDKQARLVNLFQRGSDGALAEQPRTAPGRVSQFGGGGGLSSTAADYIRFLQMLLHGGELDGVRILLPTTVALMGSNQIGAIGVPALKTAQPERSNDFTFINDGRDKWGLGFLISSEARPGLRSAGSLSWGGIDNTYFWLDPTRGVAGVILMQLLPFADSKALDLYQAFERGVYQHLGTIH